METLKYVKYDEWDHICAVFMVLLIRKQHKGSTYVTELQLETNMVSQNCKKYFCKAMLLYFVWPFFIAAYFGSLDSLTIQQQNIHIKCQMNKQLKFSKTSADTAAFSSPLSCIYLLLRA